MVQRITYSLVGVSSWEMISTGKKKCAVTPKWYLLLEEERNALKYILFVFIGTKLKVKEVVKLEL